jgi:predicted porin
MAPRLFAAALLLAAAGSAVAQESEVIIYGLIVPELTYIRATDATATVPANRPTQVPAAAYVGRNASGRTQMTPGVTHFGFRGTEKLGEGLTLSWQMESAFPIEGADTPPPALGNRNSHVGLKGAFGLVFLGIWDTPYLWSTLGVASVRGPYPGDLSTVLNSPGFNVPAPTTQSGRTNTAADAGFYRRQGNSIQYWTPDWAGLSARVTYSVNETKGVAPNGVLMSPEVFGLGVEYARGPVLLRYAYARQDDYFGLAQLGAPASGNPSNASSRATSSRDEGHKVLAIVRLGQTRLLAAADQLRYTTQDPTPGNLDSYKRFAFWGMVEQMLGANHRVWIGGGAARRGRCTVSGGGRCTTDGLGATSWTVGYRYDFSKRTDIYVSAYGVNNEESASYGPNNRPTAGGVASPGATYTALGIGLQHTF